jgi:hypothetical protein
LAASGMASTRAAEVSERWTNAAPLSEKQAICDPASKQLPRPSVHPDVAAQAASAAPENACEAQRRSMC